MRHQTTDYKTRVAQIEAVMFIDEYHRVNKYPPTVREVGKYMGFASSSTAQKIVSLLHNKKLIAIDSGIARGMRVTPLGKSVIRQYMAEISE